MKLKFNEVVGTYMLRKLNNIFCGVIYCMYKVPCSNTVDEFLSPQLNGDTFYDIFKYFN